jgi:hypothetical protein
MAALNSAVNWEQREGGRVAPPMQYLLVRYCAMYLHVSARPHALHLQSPSNHLRWDLSQ